MFVLYAFLAAILFAGLDLIYIKTFQLENYKIKNYIKKAIKFEFSFGKKSRIVFTKRLKRLICIDFVLKFSYFLAFFGTIENLWANFLIAFICLFLSEIIVILSFLAAFPLEELIKKHYLEKAKKKLRKMPCKKIAITGSYGKTSTKNILFQILKEEFDVCASPKSFNTPMGICKTILENLKETDDFLIVEYGARHTGDIEFLSKHFGVDFGIVTPIGNCHLETFGNVENIENAKYELCRHAKDVVIFNGKSKSTKNLFEKYPKKKYLVCEENSFAFATKIKAASSGCEFTLILDENEIACKTKLLGRANIDNIVVAAAMAYLLGVSIFSIVKAIEKLNPTPHRLELIKGENCNIIDDSYNSNLDGFKQALEVLSEFEGTKIVVSPGIVELGKQQDSVNKQAGKEVGEIADKFVIMNQTNKKALLEGAILGGMKENQIFFATTREQQKSVLNTIIKKGDVVLFENDFPDNFK